MISVIVAIGANLAALWLGWKLGGRALQKKGRR